MEYLWHTQYHCEEKYQTYQEDHLKNVFLEGLLDPRYSKRLRKIALL